MSLSEADIEKLEELLFSDEHLEDSLDYFGFHGLVCASTVGPKKLTLDDIQQILFSGIRPSNLKQYAQHLAYCIEDIKADLLASFDENQEAKLPYESEEEVDACIQSWCIGFVEGVLHNEALWFEDNEEIAAELLMPMMALSGLFDNEEFNHLQSNDKIMAQFETIIPDQLTNIFLYFHAK